MAHTVTATLPPKKREMGHMLTHMVFCKPLDTNYTFRKEYTYMLEHNRNKNT